MKNSIFHSDNLDDILFEHRNKEYGAYELRKSHDSRVLKSFIAALLLLTILIGGPVLIHKLFFTNPVLVADIFTTPDNIGEKIEVIQKKIIDPPLPPPQHRNLENTLFKMTADSLVAKTENEKDTIAQMSSALTSANSLTTDTGSATGQNNSIANANTPGVVEPTASTAAFSLSGVEKAPEFPGGPEALMNFLSKNIHFSEEGLQQKVTGRVFASFIINSKGEVEAIKIIHSLGYGLDEEVIRVVRMMPKWKPGFVHGNAVSTIMNLPVAFNIQ